MAKDASSLVIRDQEFLKKTLGKREFDCPECGGTVTITAALPSNATSPFFEWTCGECGWQYHGRGCDKVKLRSIA
jgi:predicted RNA-binding Zn-ribbon protein involved in translation (DUF1610 family)